jgi:formylglycine-generating enzyme required for sulfatase activity
LTTSTVLLGPLSAKADTPPATWKEPVTGMEFVAIPSGCYAMGRKTPPKLPWWTQRTPMKDGATAGHDEMPQHEVCVDAAWIGKHEVRVEDWQRVMGTPPMMREKGTPIVGVTWVQATAFAKKLTEQSAGKHTFRLPTEAEWEYACRAGERNEQIPDTAELAPVAWYGIPGQRVEQPTQVGKLQANAFGLHDMLGNAWEWVQDSYARDGYTKHALYNPVVDSADGNRVLRGGSHRSEPFNIRCGKRAHYESDASLPAFGFRLIRMP